MNSKTTLLFLFSALILLGSLGAGCSESSGASDADSDAQAQVNRPQGSPWSGGKGDIYGMDDRAETFQAAIGSWEYYLAYSSAALIREENLVARPDADGNPVAYEMAPEVQTLGEYASLCENERFSSQPAAGFCSATLVAPDLVLTAGHCLIPDQIASAQPGEALDAATGCDTLMVAFDFAYKNAADAFNGDIGAIPAGSVYRCKTIEALGFVQEPANIDWALVRLDRPVLDRDPMQMSPILPGANTPILQIGHPSGIPQKLAAGIVTNQYDFPYGELFEGNSFIYSADLFGGNSGGGVFDMTIGAVAGVPTAYSGQNFVWDEVQQCTTVGVCGVNAECAFPPGAFGTAKMREYLVDENPALLAELTFVEVEVDEEEEELEPEAPCLIIGEYIMGASFDKGLELFNCGSEPLEISGHGVCQISNGQTDCESYQTMLPAQTLGPNATFTLCHRNASFADHCDIFDSSVINQNGDDRFIVFRDDNGSGRFERGIDTVSDAFGKSDEVFYPDTKPWANQTYRRCNFSPYDGVDAFDLGAFYSTHPKDTSDDFARAPVEGC